MAIDHPEHKAELTARLPKGYAQVIASAFAAVSERLEKSGTRYLAYQLLGSTRSGRLKRLIDRATQGESEFRDAGLRIGDWFDTIGASRQVLAYEPEHFRAIASFLKAMSLTELDIALVHEMPLHADLSEFIEKADLADYLTPKHEFRVGKNRVAKAFQLDTVRIQKRRIIVKERVAMAPRHGGAISNTHELATLWLMWNLSAV